MEAGKAPVLSYFILVLNMGQVRVALVCASTRGLCWQVPGLLLPFAGKQLVMGRRTAAFHRASVHVLKEEKKKNEASVCSKCLLTAMPRAVATRMLLGPFVTLLSGHLVKYMLEFSVLSYLWLCRRALACVFFRHNISVDLTVQERIYFFAACS